jgi:hypothetical protein
VPLTRCQRQVDGRLASKNALCGNRCTHSMESVSHCHAWSRCHLIISCVQDSNSGIYVIASRSHEVITLHSNLRQLLSALCGAVLPHLAQGEHAVQ